MDTDLDSIDVASHIVKYCAINNKFINLTKLQKILYACYGVCLAAFGRRICKEHPKAWEHGPVFPKVYNVTSKNRDGFVQYLIEYNDRCNQVLTKEEIEAIDMTIEVFSKYTAGQLVEWTHLPGSPWDETQKNSGMWSVIDDDAIKTYFDKNVVKND